MNLRQELDQLADYAVIAAQAAENAAMQGLLSNALQKLRAAANQGKYELLLKPGGDNSGFTQAQCDYLHRVLGMEGGLSIDTVDVPSTVSADFALLCKWAVG